MHCRAHEGRLTVPMAVECALMWPSRPGTQAECRAADGAPLDECGLFGVSVCGRAEQFR